MVVIASSHREARWLLTRQSNLCIGCGKLAGKNEFLMPTTDYCLLKFIPSVEVMGGARSWSNLCNGFFLLLLASYSFSFALVWLTQGSQSPLGCTSTGIKHLFSGVHLYLCPQQCLILCVSSISPFMCPLLRLSIFSSFPP